MTEHSVRLSFFMKIYAAFLSVYGRFVLLCAWALFVQTEYSIIRQLWFLTDQHDHPVKALVLPCIFAVPILMLSALRMEIKRLSRLRNTGDTELTSILDKLEMLAFIVYILFAYLVQQLYH